MMKKKVLAFAAAAVFALSVSGCAGGEAAGNGGGRKPDRFGDG